MLRLELSDLVISDLYFRLVIHFVRKDHDFDFTARVFLDFVQPDRNTLEALTVCQIKDNNDAISALVVSISDGAVAFLSSRIPNLQLYGALVDLQCAESEIHANRADVVLLEAIVLSVSQRVESCFDAATYRESDEEARFADVSVPNEYHLEEVIAITRQKIISTSQTRTKTYYSFFMFLFPVGFKKYN